MKRLTLAQGRSFLAFSCLLVLPAIAFLAAPTARAVPSFARQMGVDCSQCHTQAFGPALTPFGQKFKMYGYVWSKPDAPLLPLAGMIEGPSYTWTKKGQQAGATKNFSANDNIQLDQLSGFYGGKILDKLGAFGQVTYDGVAEQTHWDNLDMRFASDATLGDTRLVYGITVNNNPTVQDLWNSTPAWGFPYASSPVAPTPAASPLIANVAQQVLGVTTYAMWNELLYTEAGAYRSLSNSTLNRLGASNLGAFEIDSLAPYWRLALQHDWSGQLFSIGTYGLYARGNPSWDSSGGDDYYTDLGFDATYQYIGSQDHIFGLDTTYIHENQNLSASHKLGNAEHSNDNLNTFNANIYYTYHQTYKGTLGYFNTTGSQDTGLYQPGSVSGSANGKPNSNGWIMELDYTPFGKPGSWLAPWANARFSLQYVIYNKFNGRNSNYDGSGRNADDNDTLYLLAWFLF